MFALLGVCVALTIMLALNAIASLGAMALWGALETRARRWPAATRVRFLLGLCLAPATVSLLTVIFLIAPSYLLLEPRESFEVVSLKLILLAILSMAGIGWAFWRGLSAWITTRRLVADWLHQAEPIRLNEISIPAYRIDHQFPLVAVVGSIRPRLFIARHVIEHLSAEELAITLAHERGHLVARDTLKRGFITACRDLLTLAPFGRSLDKAWAAAAEAAADEQAVRSNPAAALDLASALIKIARLATFDVEPTMPAGMYMVGAGDESVEWRVKRLVELAAINNSMGNSPDGDIFSANSRHLAILSTIALISSMAVAAVDFDRLLADAHALIESIVKMLQ